MANQHKDYGFPEVRGPNAERRNHLEFIDRVRIEGTAGNREFMQPMCSIPPLDWAVLKVRFPELISPDAQIKTNAWRVFMSHSVSAPYRTKERRRVNGSSI
jgi:hypothetical protein